MAFDFSTSITKTKLLKNYKRTLLLKKKLSEDIIGDEKAYPLR